MSELSKRLNMVTNRLEELERVPSELTKDALLTELRELYDVVKNVNTTHVSEQEQEAEDKPEEPAPEPASESAPTPVAATIEDEVPIEPEKPTVQSSDKEQKAPEPQSTEEPVAETPEPTVTEAETESKPFIGNTEKADKSADEKILAGQLSRKPLEDLRTGIPLNEKFGIIRSLFKGNASDYGDAVLKLNNAVSPAEMQHYLDLLQQRFGWDLESEAYQTFSVYVERKMLTLQTSDANTDQ